jgi:hypothetical protein
VSSVTLCAGVPRMESQMVSFSGGGPLSSQSALKSVNDQHLPPAPLAPMMVSFKGGGSFPATPPPIPVPANLKRRANKTRGWVTSSSVLSVPGESEETIVNSNTSSTLSDNNPLVAVSSDGGRMFSTS